MTRIEAKSTIAQLVDAFCADDVKDWLAEVCTERSGQARRAGDPDLGREWMHVANDIAAVRNRGV